MTKAVGLKQQEITPCPVCKRGVLACGNPMFYRIKIEGFVIDRRAVMRQHGLELQIGPLAAVMGPDQDLAKSISSGQALVCMDCALKPTAPLQLFEAMMEGNGNERD